MTRAVRSLNVAISLSAILLLLSCAQQGEIKEPFDIPQLVDSSDYQGEIVPFKEPVVMERLPYLVKYAVTKKKNNKYQLPTVSTVVTGSFTLRVTIPTEGTVGGDLSIWAIEIKSSKELTQQWVGNNLGISFAINLSDYSVTDKRYFLPSMSETEKEELRKLIDLRLGTITQLIKGADSYFNTPISGKNREFTFKDTIILEESGKDASVEIKSTARGMTSYFGQEAVVFDESARIHIDYLVKGEGYSIVSARDGAVLYYKRIFHTYHGSEHGQHLNEVEVTYELKAYSPW